MSYFRVFGLKQQLKLYVLLQNFITVKLLRIFFIQFVLCYKRESVEKGFYLRRHLVQKGLKNLFRKKLVRFKILLTQARMLKHFFGFFFTGEKRIGVFALKFFARGHVEQIFGGKL